MKRLTTLTTLSCFAWAAMHSPSRSNEFLIKAPAESTKYTQQLNIDVGDVPNHIVRVFELHYTFPTNAPVINGVKVVGGGLVALQTTTMGMVQTRSTSYT